MVPCVAAGPPPGEGAGGGPASEGKRFCGPTCKVRRWADTNSLDFTDVNQDLPKHGTNGQDVGVTGGSGEGGNGAPEWKTAN